MENQSIVNSPERSPRTKWEEMFRAAGSSEKDEFLFVPVDTSEFDRKEWSW
jgi:hypothetical protein